MDLAASLAILVAMAQPLDTRDERPVDRRILNDLHNLSSDALIAGAIDELEDGEDDDTVPQYLVALHGRPTRYVFDQACTLARSADPVRQTVGVRILRELGPPAQTGEKARPFSDEAIPVLEAVVADPASTDALVGALSALGYNWARSSLDLVLRYAWHDDPDVRRQVSGTLSSVIDTDETPDAVISAYERLILDADPNVRWDALWEIVENLEIPERLRAETFEAALVPPSSEPEDQWLQEQIEALARRGIEARRQAAASTARSLDDE